ncbi:MAG: PTS system mannose/fructose/N-acetylgalactosamine-transporter subunit IIB [Peptostreptococcaceae bacterium]
MITIARIDERMIHGQVAYAWTVAYKSDAILAIDDEIASDAFQKSLLEMAAPKSMRCFILNERKAIDFLKKYENKKIFIVVKRPKTLINLIKNGVNIESINVGGLYFAQGRRQISNTVYVDTDLENDFQELNSLGVKLDLRATPSDTSQELIELI